jgi:pimeloyl-ACP methyl ester carboxylesterase
MKKNNAQSIGNPLPLRILRNVYPVLEKIIPKIAFSIAFRLFFTPMRYATPDRELPIQEKAKKFTAKINGKRTQFYSWGDEHNPLAIIVHGWMGRSSQFFKLVEAFLARNYHVVGFDGPAHGASAGRSTNILEFAEAIDFISKKYGPIHCAMGHSFGGITILNAIERGTSIDNVIMIATPTIAGDIIKQFEEKINASPATGERFIKEVSKRYGISFEYMSASEIIKRIKPKHLMLVHDENDRDVPIAHARLIKDLFPEAQTIFTKGLGHTRILRNDAVINQIITAADKCLAQAHANH